MEKILVMMCHSIAQTNISPFFAASGVVLLSPETQVIPETKYILTDASKMSDAERQTSALGNAEGATQRKLHAKVIIS